MKPAELIDLLKAVYREKSAMKARHVAAARFVADYDFNNTYQYVINREEIQLQWLHDAIVDRGATPEDASEPEIKPVTGKKALLALVKADADAAQAFVDHWQDKVAHVTNARNANMLRVIIGETLEAKRFFDLMSAGRTDLLGRSADGARTEGAVLPTRWVGPGQ